MEVHPGDDLLDKKLATTILQNGYIAAKHLADRIISIQLKQEETVDVTEPELDDDDLLLDAVPDVDVNESVEPDVNESIEPDVNESVVPEPEKQKESKLFNLA